MTWSAVVNFAKDIFFPIFDKLSFDILTPYPLFFYFLHLLHRFFFFFAGRSDVVVDVVSTSITQQRSWSKASFCPRLCLCVFCIFSLFFSMSSFFFVCLCLFVSVFCSFIFLCHCVFLFSLFVSLCFSIYYFFSFLFFMFYLSLYLYLSLWSLNLCICLCLWFCLCLYFPISPSFFTFTQTFTCINVF